MNEYQVIIIGAGPAGLSAAIYTGRAGLRTLVLGCAPKVAGDYEIDNYFGFPETISGRDLLERGRQQAVRFGAEINCDRVLSIHFTEDGGYAVKTEHGEFATKALIMATGVSRVRPGIKNLADYEAKGVSYCVSCDGFFYRGRKVLVLGEGVFAANQALELKEYTPEVAVCTQGKPLTMTEAFKERLAKAGIPIIEKKIERLEGSPALERVVFADGSTEQREGLFIALGEASSLDFAYSLGLIREGTFIKTDPSQKTNLPGVFAAGDCVGRFLQISVAVGEGAIAGHEAASYLKALRQNAG